MTKFRMTAAAVAGLAVAGVAQALPLFQGRLADGTPSATCTVSGPDKCTTFYNATLDITILNAWNVGTGFWSASAAAGSAQALAASAGFAATGLTGWTLPSGDGSVAPGAQNQFRSIWNEAGGSFAALQGHFDGVLQALYHSATEHPTPGATWAISLVNGFQGNYGQDRLFYAVAVRAGDVAAVVPEPPVWALAMLALGAAAVARRLAPARCRPAAPGTCRGRTPS